MWALRAHVCVCALRVCVPAGGHFQLHDLFSPLPVYPSPVRSNVTSKVTLPALPASRALSLDQASRGDRRSTSPRPFSPPVRTAKPTAALVDPSSVSRLRLLPRPLLHPCPRLITRTASVGSRVARIHTCLPSQKERKRERRRRGRERERPAQLTPAPASTCLLHPLRDLHFPSPLTTPRISLPRSGTCQNFHLPYPSRV